MAIMDPSSSSTDAELIKLWGMVSELSAQLDKNRSVAAQLHTQSTQLKAQAIHSTTGFILRRFNADVPKDEFDAELEKFNAAVSAENQNLMYDNKQLVALLKEYEQTLEKVMSTFRTRAHEVQQRELALMRQYESTILAQESAALEEQLIVDTAMSVSIAKISDFMRKFLRTLEGEDPEAPDAKSISIDDDARNYIGSDEVIDWALDRECELVRLEKENEELRRLLEITNSDIKTPPASALQLPPPRRRNGVQAMQRTNSARRSSSASSSPARDFATRLHLVS